MLPADLIERATGVTGLGLTPTIRRGLEAIASSRAQQELRKWRGRYKLSVSVEESRRD